MTLPRLQSSIPVINVNYTPSFAFQTWWDQVARAIENGGGGGGVWGSITGTLSSQIDLQNALDAKLTISDGIGDWIGFFQSQMNDNGGFRLYNAAGGGSFYFVTGDLASDPGYFGWANSDFSLTAQVGGILNAHGRFSFDSSHPFEFQLTPYVGTSPLLTANQTITLSGDVTGSGTTAITTTIANSAVTLAKMANVSSGTVFYRKTAGSGAPETQTLATLKTDLGLTGTNSGDQTITLTGDVTGSGTGSFATTLATVNSNVGSFGSTTAIPVITVNGKGLITAVSTVTNAGGWTEKALASDASTSSVTFADITDGTTSFLMSPTANGNYEIQAILMIQTATATVLPRIGVHVTAQGTGSYGCCQIDQTGATTVTRVTQDGTWTTAAVDVQVPAGGVAAANTPYMCYVTIRGHSGASPGNISLQLASETAGTTVKVLAGSTMRWKLT